MYGTRIPFLITIDTEGDNLWGRQKEISTKNAGYLPRFQALCDRYSFKPVYLTNYEMAIDNGFVSFAREAQNDGRAEVGMHLHAWHSPPGSHSVTDKDYRFHPYLIEYPDEVLCDKIAYMTDLLTEKFDRRPTSHRAGRWSMDERYAKTLMEQGYLVDCSVTPHVSWRSNKGDPEGKGGADYRRFPEHCYFIDPDHIDRPGDSPLLEIPMTIIPSCPALTRYVPVTITEHPFLGRAVRSVLAINWFRPNRKNSNQMLRLLDMVRREKRGYIQFMIHSSELMPGGSPYFPDKASVEKLYNDLEILFEHAASNYRGMTLTEFYYHNAVV